MSTAAQQNAMMLASLLGVGEDEAADRLERSVLITAEEGWKSRWALEVAELLGRTVDAHLHATGGGIDLELVIGAALPRTQAAALYVDLDDTGLRIDRVRVGRGARAPHRLYGTAAACAATAAALHAVIGAAALPEVRLPLAFDYSALGVPPGGLDQEIVLDDAVLAGAGAVANGFLRAARHLRLRGAITVVDPKRVQEGVLNRCLYFVKDDIGRDKAAALVAHAQSDFKDLTLTSDVSDFRDFAADRVVETVFVTVDSREVRRSIQLTLPRRVVDASTTDIQGVIVHSNLLPTAHACLACIYRHVPEEAAREQSIADGLGVDLATLKKGRVDLAAAELIVATHPQIQADAIVNMSYDSLFRELCSQQALATPEGRQVLAPFAFVSAWAGVLMAVETLRSFAGIQTTNYWSVDPWNVPVARARTLRPKRADCQLCSIPDVDKIVRERFRLTSP